MFQHLGFQHSQRFSFSPCRNQGSEVRVCVTTTEESKLNGLYLNRINWFYFWRQNPEGQVRQDSILFDAQPSPTGLTNYYCQPGDEICPFDTILMAQFFDRPGVGIVQGIGEATCQYGNNSVEGPATLPPFINTPAPSVSTPAPVSPTPAPTVGYNGPDNGGVTPSGPTDAYPTPAPGPDGWPSCGSEAIAKWESDPDRTLPAGAITIDYQGETFVNFTVRQKWKDENTISWLAVLYPDDPTGQNLCPKMETVAYDYPMSFSANCFADSESVFVFIEMFIHDGSFGDQVDVYVPDACHPSKDTGKKIAYEIFIPCKPCESSTSRARLLSQVESWAVPGSSSSNSNNRSPRNLEMKPVQEARVEKYKYKSAHSSRLVQSKAKQRRSLQQTKILEAPARFEMKFTTAAVNQGSSSASVQSIAAALLIILASTGILSLL
jgi:hypothetical protein